jgi:pathogenesis-related protein 1
VAAYAQRYVETLAKSCTLAHSAGGPFKSADMVAGHYTQVVSRDSVRIGCGRVTCSKRGDARAWTLVSCNYSPPGNMLGERVYGQ